VLLTETARVKRTGHYDFDASSNKKMHNALSDLNQHNNQASYDINTVKNQVKDQVKEALLENKKKKRGGKKQKKNQKDKYGNELSNAKALNKDTEDNRRCLNYNKSNASTITGC